MKYLLGLISFILISCIFITKIQAYSDYVLPYPSSMPGSFAYKLENFKERVSKYYYYGDIGRYRYNTFYSDKYLVEAITLFNYKQYFLGYESLQKSNEYFKNISLSLNSANKHDKHTSNFINSYKSESDKHIEELEKLKLIVPFNYNWQAENEKANLLKLHALIDRSIAIRKEK